MARNSTTENSFSPKGHDPKPLLAALVKWTVRALLAINLLVFIMYSIGSYRTNSDAFQLALIRFGFFISVALVFFSVYGIIIGSIYAIREKKPSWLKSLSGYILSLIFGALMAFGTSFLLTITGGNL